MLFFIVIVSFSFNDAFADPTITLTFDKTETSLNIPVTVTCDYSGDDFDRMALSEHVRDILVNQKPVPVWLHVMDLENHVPTEFIVDTLGTTTYRCDVVVGLIDVFRSNSIDLTVIDESIANIVVTNRIEIDSDDLPQDIAAGDLFGYDIKSIGDLDGDGVIDLAQISFAYNDYTKDTDRDASNEYGAVLILFMNNDGSVKETSIITMDDGVNGVGSVCLDDPTRDGIDILGRSDRTLEQLAFIGDLDGDGNPTLALGVPRYDFVGDESDVGGVFMLELNSDGTLDNCLRIIPGENGFTPDDSNYLEDGDGFFGWPLIATDLNGDGQNELIAGASSADEEEEDTTTNLWVFFLTSTGAVASHPATPILGVTDLEITPNIVDRDFISDGDTIDGGTKIVIGVEDADTAEKIESVRNVEHGAIFIVNLTSDGAYSSHTPIMGTSLGQGITENDDFGRGVAAIGDLDGDGVDDIMVGNRSGDDTNANSGEVYILYLNSDDTVRESQKISNESENTRNGSTPFAASDFFGNGMTLWTEIRGAVIIAISAHEDDTGGTSAGAIHLFYVTESDDTSIDITNQITANTQKTEIIDDRYVYCAVFNDQVNVQFPLAFLENIQLFIGIDITMCQILSNELAFEIYLLTRAATEEIPLPNNLKATIAYAVGNGEDRIEFDQPIRITLPIQAPEHMFTKSFKLEAKLMSECVSDVTGNSYTFTTEGNECYADIGDDVIIWTNHLSFFGTATDASDPSKKKNGSGCSGDCTKPTFYKNEQGTIIVKNGFDFNNNSTDVTDYHTPYDLITVNTNQTYNIKLKAYETNNLRWFQIGFGMPEIGDSLSYAESLVTFYLNYDDTFDRIEKTDKYTLIDILNATVNMVPCGYTESQCYELSTDFVYRDQQKNNIVAIQVVDIAGNASTNYINDGILVVGESMNEPLISKTTAGKGGALYPQRSGIVELKLIDYKTDTWQDEYGYLWTRDNYKNFKITSTIPVPIKAPDKLTSIIDRDHSEFYRITDFELKRALEIFDSSKLISELPDPILWEDVNFEIDPKSIELAKLKTEYNKMIEAYKAENYLMYSQPDHTKFQQFQIKHDELNKKYANSLSLILEQIKELESTIN